jgi:acylphosphatase
MEAETRLFTVRGRVQGVWFRDSTRREAERLNITGHAINLPDGGVEVLAYGSVAALDELAAWLKSGPPLAQVAAVEVAVPKQGDSNGVPEHFRTG